MTLRQAQAQVRSFGATLRHQDGEYTVRYKGAEYFTNDLNDAVATARRMTGKPEVHTLFDQMGRWAETHVEAPNPPAFEGPNSERKAWSRVAQVALALKTGTMTDHDAAGVLYGLASAMLRQLASGVHENPPKGHLLSSRVYQVRYKHSQDGKNYEHDFGPGVLMHLLGDGTVLLESQTGKKLWKDF